MAYTNLLASRHDAPNARQPEPTGGAVSNPIVNGKAKGNVTFVDGHGEYVPRKFAHTVEHTVPDPNNGFAQGLTNPGFQ